MKVKISEEKFIEICSAEVIAVDDTWCIKANTSFEIDGKHKIFFQLKTSENLSQREIKKAYLNIINKAYEKSELNCMENNLETLDVIEADDEEVSDDDTVLAALILRTEEILTKEFFNTLLRCAKLEKENKPLALLAEIGVLRGLKYSLATCNINFDEKAEKKFTKYMKLQEQLKNVGTNKEE